MSEKITGYILLAAGLIIIIFGAYQIYQVFTGAQLPIPVTQSEGISMSVSPDLPKAEIISGKEIDQITNLTLHYLLMTFMVTVGYKISSLGIQLLRTIEVKVNQKTA